MSPSEYPTRTLTHTRRVMFELLSLNAKIQSFATIAEKRQIKMNPSIVVQSRGKN